MSSKIIRTATDHKEDIQSISFDPLPDGVRPAHPGSPAARQESAIADVSSQAEVILREAQQRAVQLEQEALQRGYNEGMQRANLETDELVTSLREMAQTALAEKWRYISNVEANIVELAIEIADKVVCEHVKIAPNTVIAITKKALMVAAQREQIAIRVNPDDLELMKKHKEELMSSMDGIQKIELIPDRRITKGGCILETVTSNIDARLQSQLKQVEESMKAMVSDE